MKNANPRNLRRISYVSIIFILVMTVIGCATGEKMSRISPGISQDNVIGSLGRPDGFRTEGEYSILKYTNRLISGWSWDRADYFVILKDNKVVAYGPGEVREKNVGGVHTVFLYH